MQQCCFSCLAIKIFFSVSKQKENQNELSALWRSGTQNASSGGVTKIKLTSFPNYAKWTRHDSCVWYDLKQEAQSEISAIRAGTYRQKEREKNIFTTTFTSSLIAYDKTNFRHNNVYSVVDLQPIASTTLKSDCSCLSSNANICRRQRIEFLLLRHKARAVRITFFCGGLWNETRAVKFKTFKPTHKKFFYFGFSFVSPRLNIELALRKWTQ